MRDYQTEIAPETLYGATGSGQGDGSSLAPFIEIVGGTGNVYGSTERPSNPPDDMALANEDPFEGIMTFGMIPNFLFVTQESGTISQIIVSGVDIVPETTA